MARGRLTSEDIEGLDVRVMEALRDASCVEPTTIQAHAMPLLIRGRIDGLAQTGSGKTAVRAADSTDALRSNFLPVILDHLAVRPGAVTDEELAAQIADVATQLSWHAGLRVVLATGGADMRTQRRELAQGCDVLVGTPGRVLQWADERVVNLRSCREVVVDEADRMLDLGFEPQLRRIARLLGSSQPTVTSAGGGQSLGGQSARHTVLCSATFPSEVQRLASEFLRADYFFVAQGRVGATHSRIEQRLVWEDGGESKRQAIAAKEVRAFLSDARARGVEAEASTPRGARLRQHEGRYDRLGGSLRGVWGGVRVVHGDKDQSSRNRALADFRDGRCSTLVATDVAARGLDVPGVGLVVQCDMPRDADTFVHRVGRTGRAGASGRAVAVVDGRALGLSPRLVQLLSEAAQPVPACWPGWRTCEGEATGGGAIAAGGGWAAIDLMEKAGVAEDGEAAEDGAASEFSEQDSEPRGDGHRAPHATPRSVP